MLNSENQPPRVQVGLGIRPELFSAVRTAKPQLAFFEAHSENYFGDSLNRDYLIELAQSYAISLHGVGLSLGRSDALNVRHLSELRRLADAIRPLFVSEHLAWSAYQHQHLPDLLPLPLTDQAYRVVCDHIKAMQDALGRQVLIENPSNYALFDNAQIPEPQFLNQLAQTTGCGLLVDVNNVYVSSVNIGINPNLYIEQLETTAIKQYHLAGYTPVMRELNGEPTQLLIDTHNQAVHEPVWELYSHTLGCHGARPTLVEWDSDYPALEVLLEECHKAERLITASGSGSGCRSGSRSRSISPVQTKEALQDASQPMHKTIELQSFQMQFLHSVLGKQPRVALFVAQHAERVGVYQNNVFAALYDYLVQVYPALNGVLGGDFFRQLCREFCAKHPPQDGDIHLYGESIYHIFEQFEALNAIPYLVDLAHYEWALHRAYFVDQGNLLDHSLEDQEQLLTSSVRLNPSVALINSTFPIAAIYEQSLPDFEDTVSISLQQSSDKLLVYKHQQQVGTLLLNKQQFDFFKRLQNPTTLLQAIEGMSGSLSEQDLSYTLSLCFMHGLLNPFKQ